jgi:hypothetical protein
MLNSSETLSQLEKKRQNSKITNERSIKSEISRKSKNNKKNHKNCQNQGHKL